MNRLCMICYDIHAPRARRRVEKTLLAHGERVQESVFECYLPWHDLTPLLETLAQEIDPETDSLRLYPLCAWCRDRIAWHGLGRASDDPDLWII